MGFAVPFFTLLSRNLKLKPRLLAVVAVYLLAMHAVDLYWLIWPAYSPQGPSFHWTLLTAFVGVGDCRWPEPSSWRAVATRCR